MIWQTCTAGFALEALSADEENLMHSKRSKFYGDMPWRKSKSERRRKKVCICLQNRKMLRVSKKLNALAAGQQALATCSRHCASI